MTRPIQPTLCHKGRLMVGDQLRDIEYVLIDRATAAARDIHRGEWWFVQRDQIREIVPRDREEALDELAAQAQELGMGYVDAYESRLAIPLD